MIEIRERGHRKLDEVRCRLQGIAMSEAPHPFRAPGPTRSGVAKWKGQFIARPEGGLL